MGTCYGQLTESERSVVARLHAAGRSCREIGRVLCRSASTISREVRRNSQPTKAWPGGYDAARAQALAARRRRWDARFKLACQPALRALVRDRLAMGWSPGQIAGRLARQHAGTVVSHESIYRYIYHRSAQKDYWHRLLPRARHRRGRLGKRGGSPVQNIKGRVPVHARPAAAADRRQPGHWEADLMLFRRYGQAVLVLHERSSRLTRLVRQPDKAAARTRDSLKRLLAVLPDTLRRSITFDNGTEFARHHQLGIDTYFCDPHAPWQKGGVENAVGRLRRALPRKTDLATLSQKQLNRIAEAYNTTPRQCLGFKTPLETFSAFNNNVALET